MIGRVNNHLIGSKALVVTGKVRARVALKFRRCLRLETTATRQTAAGSFRERS